MRNRLMTAGPQGQLPRDRCPECGGLDQVTDSAIGEVVCCHCGLVIHEILLDSSREWRAFTPEESMAKSRTGSPTSLIMFDKGLTTTFRPEMDARGRLLPTPRRSTMLRLRKWQSRAGIHSSAARNLSQAMSDLARLVDTLHLPKSVQEDAAFIYRQALNADLARGRSIKGLAAASLYAACRRTQTPRSLTAVVAASTRGRKEVSRCYRLIQQELRLQMPLDDAAAYISKIAEQVGLSQKTQSVALRLLQRAKDRRVTAGKSPVGVATAALYIASIVSGERTTQKQLAEAAKVTEVTVRNRYKKLAKDLGLSVPSV